MSSFDFIIDNIRFSYSALTTFESCPYSYRMTYIDKLMRAENFYGQYGTLIHDTMYQYFAGNLDAFELSSYFNQNYNMVISEPPPMFPPGMGERYREAGMLFFDTFSFDKSDYDVLLNEEKIDFDFDDNIQFVAKPDLVLFNKVNGKFILYDYKTSAPFRIDKSTGKETVDKDKLEGYYKQMYIYTYALRNYKFIPVDEITLWFTRPDRKVSIPWKEKSEEKAIKWLYKVVKKIKTEERFDYNNSNSYYCNNLCGVRLFCEYR